MDNFTSDSSDSDSEGNKVIDLAYLLLDLNLVNTNLSEYLTERHIYLNIEKIILHHNQLPRLPENLWKFSSTKILDISNTGLSLLPDLFKWLPLTVLTAKNNDLTNNSLPKTFNKCPMLKELNLSGNHIVQFPEQILDFVNLKFLYLGGNGMKQISKRIGKLKNLQVVSFGGNQITEVPTAVGHLDHLQALVLCDNQLEYLPADIANLHRLKSLLLHKNKLKTLPPEIIALKNLTELSLRDNPLVVNFVSEMTYTPATLLELSARMIKLHNVPYLSSDIPPTLDYYLKSAHHCVNPNCKGVYFDNRVEHIKFVDFCGKYRIPLLQYLCSSKCAGTTITKDDLYKSSKSYMMKKVLLG